MPTDWRVYGQDTIACRLSKADLPGFFRKQIVVGPHEAALVVRNAKVEEAITEKRAKVAGLFDRLAGVFRRGAEVDVLFVTLAPFDFRVYLGETTKESISSSESSATSASGTSGRDTADLLSASRRFGWVTRTESQKASAAEESSQVDVSQVAIQAVSLDQEVIRAECLFRACIDIEEVDQVAALMRGKVALATWDLAALVRDELLARTLIPEIAAHRADELRGNRQLLDKLERDVRTGLKNTFATCGLTLESFTINWGLTDQERADIDRKRQEREEEARKFAHGRRLAEMQREVEIDQTRVTNLQQIKVAEAEGEEELKELHLAGEIHRELMVEGKRVDEAKVDAQIRLVELDIQEREAKARLEQRRSEEMLRLEIEDREFEQRQRERLARIEGEEKEMRGMVRMQIEMATAKHERTMAERRQELDAEYRRLQAQLDERLERIRTRKELIAKGLETGAADASVLRTLLEQDTEQAYADASDAKVQARAEAEAAKGSLTTYQEAEDRERRHQRDMTGLSTQMMQGAKQDGPGASTAASGAAQTGSKCPQCGEAVQPGWKVCPACGQKLGAPSPKCPSCNSDVQIGWKACPNCGAKLATRCPNCGKDVQPTWKACPQCGQALS